MSKYPYMVQEIARMFARSVTRATPEAVKRKHLVEAFEKYEGHPPSDESDDQILADAWECAKDHGVIAK